MLKKTIVAAASSVVLCVPVQAQETDKVCGAYSAFGEVMAVEMLDLTLRDIIGMMQGSRPDVMNKITVAIENGLTAGEIMALTALSETEQSLLGEAAGTHAVNLLMGGSVSTASEVRATMLSNCVALGHQGVIDNQRSVNELMQGR